LTPRPLGRNWKKDSHTGGLIILNRHFYLSSFYKQTGGIHTNSRMQKEPSLHQDGRGWIRRHSQCIPVVGQSYDRSCSLDSQYDCLSHGHFSPVQFWAAFLSLLFGYRYVVSSVGQTTVCTGRACRTHQKAPTGTGMLQVLTVNTVYGTSTGRLQRARSFKQAERIECPVC
jgi:hypothetical protein